VHGSSTTIAMLSILALAAAWPATAAEDFEGLIHYWGDLHAHTGYSVDGGSNDLGNCNTPGACGNATEFFAIARDTAQLDFCAITDHVNGPSEVSEEDWASIVALVAEANDPAGGFVSLLGAEMAHVTEDSVELGHRNTYFFADDGALAGLTLDEVRAPGGADACEDIWPALAQLDATYGPLLHVPHHPAPDKPMATDWSCQDDLYSPVVEVYSVHGNSLDGKEVASYDTSKFELVEGTTVFDALSPPHEHRLGLVGGSDLHDTMPGMVCHLDDHQLGHEYGGSLTGAVLDDGLPLSRMALYGAIRARHTYATSGPKIPVSYTLVDDDDGILAILGDVHSPVPPGGVRLRVAVPPYAAPYVPRVELRARSGVVHLMNAVGDGEFELELSHVELPWWGYAVVFLDGGSWWADLGVECEDGGDTQDERIWTSPIWIEWWDGEDDDGDGISDLGGDCDDLDPEIHPGATEVPNGLDDDCDGLVDEQADALDADGDGHVERDCDDTDPHVYPGAPHRCDDVQDNDCDGLLDLDEADVDGDGWTPCDGDCDDDDGRAHPGADTGCDGVPDNDCDGVADPDEADRDADGVTVCGGDCDDLDLLVRPGAAETRNGIDDDCDGDVDEGLSGCDAASRGAPSGWGVLSLIAATAVAAWRRRQTPLRSR